MNDLTNILYLTRAHNIYMSNRIDLIPSNALTSNFARFVLGSSLPNNSCLGLPGDRFYGGCTYIDMIERAVQEMSRRAFGNMKYVVLQFLSRMQANLAAYHALLNQGDAVVAATAKHGGHFGQVGDGPLRFFGVRLLAMPFDDATYNVDPNRLEDLVKKEKPSLIMLGGNERLFPYPLAEIRQICDRYQVKLSYDMSLVAGLIAGGQFQTDAAQYADILISSTGSSLHSPDHALLMFNDESLHERICQGVKTQMTANTHPHEIAALGVVLAEMNSFGREYALQTIGNAKALARALDKEGVRVLFKDKGFTESHTIMLEVPMATAAVTLLDRAGILCSSCLLPWDQDEPSGIRIATHILTRHGLRTEDMPKLAKILSEILVAKKEPEGVYFKTVQPFAASLKKIAFSFDGKFPTLVDWYERVIQLHEVESVPAVLASNQAFAGCSMDEILAIEKYFKLIKCKQYEIVFKADDPSDAVYFVANGSVDILDQADASKRVIVKQSEGTHFGELGVMTGNKRKFAARADMKAVVLRIEKDDFLKIVAEYGSIKKHFDRYIVSLSAPVVVTL